MSRRFSIHPRASGCRTILGIAAGGESSGRRVRRDRRRDVRGSARTRWAIFYRLLGGSMRIGNRLGGAVVWAIVAAMAATLGRGADAAERVQPVPLGGSLAGQSGDRALRRLCPDPVRRRADRQGDRRATVEHDHRPRRPASGRTARRSATNAARLVHLHGRPGPTKPYTVETTFVQVGQSTPQALELLLLAHQVRRDPRALGRRQRPGRHDAGLRRRRSWSPPRAATSPPARTSSAPAPTACSRPPSPPATTRPGSPTSMTT